MSLVYMPVGSAYGLNIKPSQTALWYFYEVGTTTLKTPWQDQAETIPHTNPVVSDENGVFPRIYISGLYKSKITDLNGDNVQGPWDNLQGRDGDLIDQGTFDSTTNGGDYPASGSKGDVYRVTEEFVTNAASGSTPLFVDDWIVANKDGATGIEADWDVKLGGNSRQKVADISSKNLLIDVTGNTTVDVDADVLNLLDSSNRVKQLTNVDLTFTMPTDLLFGTEKASHWYDLWTDEDGLHKLTAQLTGTADADVTNSLSASAMTFQTDGVKAGYEIYQTTDNTKGYVKAVSSETLLTCMDEDGADLDLFPAGTETFIIKAINPTGLGNYQANVGKAYNNAASNFDNSRKNGKGRITEGLWHTLNGFGSTNGNVVKFTTEVIAPDNIVASMINSSVNGLIVTANMDCKVRLDFDYISDAAEYFGFSKNSSQLSTAITAITAADVLGMSYTSTTNVPDSISRCIILKKDDFVAFHSSGTASTGNPERGRACIVAEEII